MYKYSALVWLEYRLEILLSGKFSKGFAFTSFENIPSHKLPFKGDMSNEQENSEYKTLPTVLEFKT